MFEVLAISIGGIWLCTYFLIMILDNKIAFVTKEQYFGNIFYGFRNSQLRTLWKWIYLGVLYIIGIIILGWYKSAEYPVKWTKATVHYIFYAPDLKEGKKNDSTKNKKRPTTSKKRKE